MNLRPLITFRFIFRLWTKHVFHFIIIKKVQDRRTKSLKYLTLFQISYLPTKLDKNRKDYLIITKSDFHGRVNR